MFVFSQTQSGQPDLQPSTQDVDAMWPVGGYARVPEDAPSPDRRRRWALLGLVAATCGVAVGRTLASTPSPAAFVEATATDDTIADGTAGDDDWPYEEMYTPNLDGVPVNVILSAPTPTSIIASCWCSTGSNVTVTYWEAGKPATAKALGEPCGDQAAMRLTLYHLTPGTKYAYVASIRGGADVATTAEHGFSTPGAPTTRFTVSADAHLYSSEAHRAVTEAMASSVSARAPDFHVQVGCAWMLDQFVEYEANYSDVFDFIRGTRYWFGGIGSDAALYHVQGPHAGENFMDYHTCRVGRNLSAPALAMRSQWSAIARRSAYPAPEANAFYSGSDVEDSYLPCVFDGESMALSYPAVEVGNRRSYYAFETGGVLVIALDTWWYYDVNQLNGTNWMFTLGRKQYEWLQETLSAKNASRTVVMTHNLVGGYAKTFDYSTQRGGARAAPMFEWGGRGHSGNLEFDQYRPGWTAPIHDLLVAHGVDAVVHGHDHVTAVEFVDGVMYLELPWMLGGGATDIEIEAYLGTDKAYWDRERPSYASFESSEDGGLRLSIVDIFTDEEAYGHTFQ